MDYIEDGLLDNVNGNRVDKVENLRLDEIKKRVLVTDVKDEIRASDSDSDELDSRRSKEKVRAKSLIQSRLAQKRIVRRLRRLIKKSSALTIEEATFLKDHEHLASSLRTRRELADSRKLMLQDRLVEHREEPESLETKLDTLVAWIRESQSNIVVYTGAGMSTAASIPDYRGPNGKWTLLHSTDQNPTGSYRRQPRFSLPEASFAAPTVAHLVLARLVETGFVSHVVSQNVDGLHVRSGLPIERLSELHGNLFVELCAVCPRAIYRLVDVCERSKFHYHRTERLCPFCGTDLNDSLVHFGEKSRPGGEGNLYRWGAALKAAASASMVLCFGSSLAVMRHYAGLWPKGLGGKNPKQRLVIVNLQWTPKDRMANLKINANCNEVMEGLARRLELSPLPYDMENDPLCRLATSLTPAEKKGITRPFLDLKSK